MQRSVRSFLCVVAGLLIGLTISGPLGFGETPHNETSKNEEYMILNYRDRPGDAAVQAMLNESAKDGWKVRALDWNQWRIIMVR